MQIKAAIADPTVSLIFLPWQYLFLATSVKDLLKKTIWDYEKMTQSSV